MFLPRFLTFARAGGYIVYSCTKSGMNVLMQPTPSHPFCHRAAKNNTQEKEKKKRARCKLQRIFLLFFFPRRAGIYMSTFGRA